jgi:hypothetical protein
VHAVVHPDWSGELLVGRGCAEQLTADLVNPARQEAELRQQATTRRRQQKAFEVGRVKWSTQQWRRSAKGNAWTKYRGTHVVVFPSRFGSGWRFVVDGEFGRATYASEPAAMQASFDDVFRAVQAKAKVQPAVKVELRVAPCPPCLMALGLSTRATLDEIKSAFRRLTWTVHPDLGGNAADFVKLRWNYEEAVRLTTLNGKAH